MNDSQPDSLSDTADQTRLLDAAVHEPTSDARAAGTAVAAAGNEGAENGADASGVAAPEKNAASTKPAANKSTQGVFGKLSKLLGGDKDARCTCGRSGSGKQGRHAKTCPVSVSSGGAAPKHFQPVILADTDAPETREPVPLPAVPDVPPDYSLWGRLAKTSLELLDRAVKKAAYFKCKKVLDSETARECADELTIDDKEIKSFSESATRCAEHYKKNPQHAPLVDLCLQGGMIGVGLWTGFDRLDERLKKIESKQNRVIPANQTESVHVPGYGPGGVTKVNPALRSTRQPD